MSVKTIQTSTRGFVRSSAFLVTTLALAAALPVSARAATPVVVWDGDFTATRAGYALNLNGNALSGDKTTITINQNVGVTVTAASTFSGGFTVLFKYSDLNLSLAAKQVLATSTLTDANDRTGVTIDTTGKSCGIWAGNSWNNSGTYNSMTSSQASGVLAFLHYSTSTYSGVGTRMYYLDHDDSSVVTILDADTLGSDNDKNKYKGFAIGGRSAAASEFSSATGMKISAIAVFVGIISSEEMLSYRFPSDIVQGACTLALSANTNWVNGAWSLGGETVTAPTAGDVAINVSGDVELLVDETVALDGVVVAGEGSLTIRPDQPNNVTFTASTISSDIPIFFANDGIGIDAIFAPVTYLYTVASIASSSYGNTYAHGAGSVSETTTNAVAIGHNGGIAVLDGTDGTPFYLQASDNGTVTTVVMTNVTANYINSLGVGAASYAVAGQSVVNTGVNTGNPQSFVLSQGGAGRASTFLLKDTSVVNVAGTSDVDSNQASIMFGHWNGPSTFTIQDSAAFNAVCEVLVGKTSNNHTININGGTFTAKGIKASASASGKNALNLNGGRLVLGASGIASYSSSTTIPVNVNSASEICASAAELPISQDITIASAASLSLTKSEGVPSTVVTLSGVPGGDGSVSVADGVTLKLGTIRPSWTFTVDGILAVTLANKAEVVALSASKQPAAVVLYDVDGTTEISNARVSYDNGTLTVGSSNLIWANTLGDGKFDNEGNWDSRVLPSGAGTDDVVVNVVGETSITVTNDYTVGEFIVAGGGTASFSGDGSVAANTTYVIVGSTLDTNGRVMFKNLSLESSTTGIVASADGLANGGLTGAGTFVMDPGAGVTNTMSSANTSFTGEAVIASGTVKMGDATSFGPTGRSSVIRVKGGATLDTNGATNSEYNKEKNMVVLEEGARFTSTVANANDFRDVPCTAITLEGNATVDASIVSVGLAQGWDYNSAHLDVGSYTLQKIGSFDFRLSAIDNISGTGVLDIRNGSISICNSIYGNHSARMTNGKVRVASGSYFKMVNVNNCHPTFAVKNLELNGAVTRDSTDSTLTVTGYITGNGTTPMLTLGANAVFKPTGTGYLTITESLTLPTVTVGEEESAKEVPYMRIDLTDALASGAKSIPLFKVGSAENLPDAENVLFVYPGQDEPSQALPRGWKLSTIYGGCGYKLSKGTFSILLR